MFNVPLESFQAVDCTDTTDMGGGMAEWLSSLDGDREVVGSNPGVARSDGQ